MTTTAIIIALVLIGLYFFYRRLAAKAKNTIEVVPIIEKVKAATYIICPNCGAHLEVAKDE